jgi:hypothetical protein
MANVEESQKTGNLVAFGVALAVILVLILIYLS